MQMLMSAALGLLLQDSDVGAKIFATIQISIKALSEALPQTAGLGLRIPAITHA
jgi:hypothetical protein